MEKGELNEKPRGGKREELNQESKGENNERYNFSLTWIENSIPAQKHIHITDIMININEHA